jgi:hypothetical protein
MSAEITVTTGLASTKNGATISSGTKTSSHDQSGDQGIGNIQIVGTSWEALVLGDVSSIGFVRLLNLDATNYVEVALANDNSQVFAKMKAGEAALFRASTATMYVRANTAACNVHVVAVED